MSKGTVFITGGARRVGKTIALALARDGYDIALHYNSSKHDAEMVMKEIHTIGVDCRLFSCDIKQTSQLKDIMNDVFSQCQDCNILINNASIFDRVSFQDSNEQDFDDNFAVHVKAPYFLSQAFAQHCDDGSIINMVDTKVHRTLTEYFAYTLSKKSLFELTKMLAKALAPKIRVNGIAPGYILPPVDGSETDVERVQNSIPLQRLGNPELIAQTVLYMLNNPFMTGEIITVDGGERLK